MQTQDAYNNWAQTYDTVINKTRDVEADAIKSVIGNLFVEKILEIGCGTGKNTGWLAEKCRNLIAIDFSQEMLDVAKQKINSEKVSFQHTDITKPWAFDKVNLITCSLVLEHIYDLSFVFKQASAVLEPGGIFYICELHPYKQLQGGRAKFEHGGKTMHLEYFIHHMSDYFDISRQNNFVCVDLNEWFDSDEKRETPRLVSFLFRRS